MNPQEYTQSIKSRISELVTDSFEASHRQKFAAHERLFKLVMSLSTLSLTGWVAIVAWNFEPFSSQKDIVWLSCSLFIGTLMLFSLSDATVIVQSLASDKINTAIQVKWFRTSKELDGMSVLYESNKISMPDYLSKVDSTFFAGINEASKKHKWWNRLQKSMHWSSWLLGISGYVLFFCSVWFGIGSMTNYLAKAQELRAQQKLETATTTTPKKVK